MEKGIIEIFCVINISTCGILVIKFKLLCLSHILEAPSMLTLVDSIISSGIFFDLASP